jgi:hypothetical protein
MRPPCSSGTGVISFPFASLALVTLKVARAIVQVMNTLLSAKKRPEKERSRLVAAVSEKARHVLPNKPRLACTDPPSKAERIGARIELGVLPEETRGIELVRVLVLARVASHSPFFGEQANIFSTRIGWD